MDENREISDSARALAARRRRMTGACAVCGAAITGITTRKFCSAACKVKAFRQRAKSDATRATEEESA